MHSEHAQHYYLVGIKGQGMTALAGVLQSRGAVVEGSDTEQVFSTDAVLQRLQIPVHAFTLPLPALPVTVIYSTAYQPAVHSQLKEATGRGLLLITYPEAVGTLFHAMEGIAVAGSHGKTTTTAMIGTMLADAGKDPTVLVGSAVQSFGGNARIGRSSLLVVETDEYQNKFRYYHPRHLVVTNIDYDHPDFFPDADVYAATFAHFMAALPEDGNLVVCSDDEQTQKIVSTLRRPVITFGKNDHAQFRLLSSSNAHDHQSFTFVAEGKERMWTLPLPGEHNALNALAALALCRALGAEWAVLQRTLEHFNGVARRFEKLGEYNGAPLIDDFAHHPAEIAAVIAGTRQRYPEKRVVVVFQPHTYSRTQKLLKQFAESLAGADEVIVLAIVGSARETEKTVSSQDLVALLSASCSPRYLSTIEQAASYLRNAVHHDAVVLLLGAGEQWKIAGQLQPTKDGLHGSRKT